MRPVALATILALTTLSAIETAMLARKPEPPFALEHEVQNLRRSNADRMEFCGFYVQVIARINNDLRASHDPTALESAAAQLKLASSPAFFRLCAIGDTTELVTLTRGSAECWSRHDYECLWGLSQWLMASTVMLPRDGRAP